MTMLALLSFAAGILAVASPCVLPVVPFLAAGPAGVRNQAAWPTIVGLASGFAIFGSLAAAAGGWAVEASRYGRLAALFGLAVLGTTLVVPAAAAFLARPLVNIGARLSARATSIRHPHCRAFLLGIASGLVWTPCAGPVLGLVLVTAALHGPSVFATGLLFAFGAGAATAVSLLLTFGRGLIAAINRKCRWAVRGRLIIGLTVLASVALIAGGFDTRLLALPAASSTDDLERGLLDSVDVPTGTPASPAVHAPLNAFRRDEPWLNGPTLSPERLRGKVVLVNFWTYSCINCLRTIAYLKTWSDRYREAGLIVIGVHSPEFAFEKNPGNVRTALRTLGITYPVVQDNDFAIWQAFGNEAWPAFFLMGADGRVVRRKFGEEDYGGTERAIRAALAAAHLNAAPNAIPLAPAPGTQASPDWADLGSPETYVGYLKADRFASAEKIVRNRNADYTAPDRLQLNAWALAGPWQVGGEFATGQAPGASIVYHFRARDLHLVLASATPGVPIRFRVSLDGRTPGADHGSDTDAQGNGVIRDAKLYQLVRQRGLVRDRVMRIEFTDPGARTYCFTFG